MEYEDYKRAKQLQEEVYINGISGFVLDEIMEHYTFADGLPFGVKVEE